MFTFDVDFEMYGKDLTESAILSNKICKTLGKNPPNGFAYELFLDEKGENIKVKKEMEFLLNSGLDMHHQRACLFICIPIQKELKNFMQKLYLKQLMIFDWYRKISKSKR